MTCWARTAEHISRGARVLNFPGHWTGVGLLLLRGAVGITAARQAWLAIASTPELLGTIPAAAFGACAIALALGLFTRTAGVLVALGYALVLVGPVDRIAVPRFDGTSAVIGLAAVVALALGGPGAFSIDARLFGRREIFIPGRKSSG